MLLNPLPPDRVPALLGHLLGKSLGPDLLDPQDARPAVAAEDKPEHSGDEVIVPRTLVDVAMLAALGTTRQAVIDTTRPHLAPAGFLVLVTPRTAALAICAARTAIKAAIGNQLHVRRNRFHDVHLRNFLTPMKHL